MNENIIKSIKGFFDVRLIINSSFESMQKKVLSRNFNKRVFVYDLEFLKEIKRESNNIIEVLNINNLSDMLDPKSIEVILDKYNSDEEIKNAIIILSEKFDNFSYTLKAESKHELHKGLLKNLDKRIERTDLDLDTTKLHKLLVDSGVVYRNLNS